VRAEAESSGPNEARSPAAASRPLGQRGQRNRIPYVRPSSQPGEGARIICLEVVKRQTVEASNALGLPNAAPRSMVR
jgi:hypothetical protein